MAARTVLAVVAALCVLARRAAAEGGSTLPVPTVTLPCGQTWSDVFAQFPELSVKRSVLEAHPEILEMLPPPDANLSTLFAVTDAAYAAIDTDADMAAFKEGSNTPSLDLARLEVRLPLPKAASMWLFRALQRPYSLDDLRGLGAVPTALAAATEMPKYKLFFTPINLRGGVRSVVIDDLLMTVTATPVLKSVQVCGSWMHLIDTYLWPAPSYNVSQLPDPVPGGHYIQAAPGTAPPGDDTPIPSDASLFNAAAAAAMPVPFAAARRKRAIAAGAGSAAALLLLGACVAGGLAGRRAWRASRAEAERAGCERGLAMGMSNATASSTGGGGPGGPPWPELNGGGGKPGGGGGVALSGALAALAAARAGDGPDGDGAHSGALATGDTLADALAARAGGTGGSTAGGGPVSGGGPRTGASTLGPGGGASGSTRAGTTGGAGGPGAAASTPGGGRDAPAPDDWAQCLAAELGPSGWALDGSSVRILTTPDGRPRRLGEGGFGTVYLAEMHATQVAVKLLSTQQPREVRRFIGEASILKELRHTNVVQFLGAYCGEGGQVALVCEYLPRGDLYRLLGRDFDRAYAWWRRGRGVALDIARGVLYMHTRSPPIIHLDIKSANVLLARDFTAKVADVGLAKVLSRADTKVSLEGTFDYAAPELLSGERVSEKADVYSLGVVLWELVTGESPRNRQLRPVVAGDGPPAECPPSVAAAIEACRARDPAARPSARELFDILAATPPVARPSQGQAAGGGGGNGGGNGGGGGSSGLGGASGATPTPGGGGVSGEGPTAPPSGSGGAGGGGSGGPVSGASAAGGGSSGGGGDGRGPASGSGARAPPSAFG